MATIRSIRDIRERFQVNWNGYLAQYWIFLLLLAVAYNLAATPLLVPAF